MKGPKNGTGTPPKPALPWLDRAIKSVSPGWALDRAQNRLRLHVVEGVLRRKFEGADSGRRTERWITGAGDANVEMRSSLKGLRNRSRALSRDEAYGRRAIGQWSAWMVGGGWQPDFEDEDPREDAWNAWANTRACDVEGLQTFRMIQRTLARCWFESGEVLVLRRWAPEKEIPLELAVYEPDYLDESKDSTGMPMGGARVVQGVQLDSNNRVQGYWIHQEHPGSAFGSMKPSRFFPVEDVIHLYLRERAGQFRGLPLVHAILLRMRDWGELSDAKLQQQKVAACFVGVEHDIGDLGGAIGQTAQSEAPVRDAEPGAILRPPSGKTIEFNDTPDPGPFRELASEFLHELAAGVDLPYEVLAGNLEKLSFSSARIGYFPFHVILDDLQECAWTPALERILEWHAQACTLRGLPGFGPDAEPVEWTPPARPQMDPGAEANANVTNVRAGFDTHSGVIRRTRGVNARKLLTRARDDFALLDELGLSLDTDPRKFGKTASGAGADIMEEQAKKNDGDAEDKDEEAAPKKKQKNEK